MVPGTVCASAARPRGSKEHLPPPYLPVFPPLSHFTHPTLHLCCRALSLPRHVTRAPAGGCRGAKPCWFSYSTPNPAQPGVWISSSGNQLSASSLLPCLLFYKNYVCLYIHTHIYIHKHSLSSCICSWMTNDSCSVYLITNLQMGFNTKSFLANWFTGNQRSHLLSSLSLNPISWSWDTEYWGLLFYVHDVTKAKQQHSHLQLKQNKEPGFSKRRKTACILIFQLSYSTLDRTGLPSS